MTSAARDAIRVVDAPEHRRYEARRGDEVVGFIDYRAVGNRRLLIHTEVGPNVEGQGVGSRLVTGALEDIRARGLVITVKCPFVAAFLERHPEYSDLLAGPVSTRTARSSQPDPTGG